MSEKHQNGERVSDDPRFAGIHNDPKFRSTKSKNFKIKLDDRFSKKDLEVKRKAKVDRYGRKISKDESKEAQDFDKYFSKKKEGVAGEKEDENDEEALAEEDEASVKTPKFDRARGEVPSDYFSSSEEESSSDSEEDSEDSQAESDEEIELEDSKPEAGDPTKTLAVVNLDWDHVKSVDLMVTFSSFVPKGGNIKKISVYPSEFGKERMQREEIEGPPKELFQSKLSSKKTKDESDSTITIKDMYEEGDAEKDYDSKALRRYQLDRLRYYYAVVYCSDVRTAQSIYQNCDGTEYESTANMFDLRYVPDEMEFDDAARDECTSIPKNYKPSQFSTDALQHSKVKLTWDETPADRVEISKRAFTQKEIEDMDFKAYLASDSEESENEHDDTLKNKLKSLVMDSVKVGNKSIFDEQDGADEEVDMEITFTPGLEEEQKEAKAEDDEESTIDKIRRKEKERRKKRKERVKELKKSTDEKIKETKKKTNNLEGTSEEQDKKKAELELLMLEDDQSNSKINNKAHFNMNEILKSEKEKSKKSKYQNKERIIEDEFKPDLNDPRFKEVFEEHEFAIDPSQPEFKSTQAMKQILKERSKRSNKNSNNKKRSINSVESTEEQGEKNKINKLVQKLKSNKKRSKK